MGEIRKDYSPTLSSPRITFGPDGKPQISRRFALRAAGTALLGLALSGCALQPTPVAAPAATAVPTAGESARQATAEPTIAPQALLVSPEPAKPQRPPITANMLKKGLTGIGDQENPTPIPVPTQEPSATKIPEQITNIDLFKQAQILFRTSPVKFAKDPLTEKPSFTQINSTGLNALKYVIAELSTYGSEGLNISISGSFPQLPLTVARLTLHKLTDGNSPSYEFTSAGNGFTVHHDTHITIIGGTNGQVLVSFSDSTRGDNCEFITLVGIDELTDLLTMNSYQSQRNDNALIIFQGETQHQVQKIQDDDFIKNEIWPEMGAVFIDATDNNGTQIMHPFPVVPFPDTSLFPTLTDPALLKYQVSSDGRTVTAVDADGKILTIATYNSQKVNDSLSPEVAAWEWKKYEAPQWYESKDMEDRRKGVEKWVNGLKWEDYSDKDIVELKQLLIEYLPHIHTSPLTVFPWFNKFPFDFPENPLIYLENVHTISNWDGKGTGAGLDRQVVQLDRTMDKDRTDEIEVEWITSVMKEAMGNAVWDNAKKAAKAERHETPEAIFLANFVNNNVHRVDIGTVSAEIITRADLLDANVLAKPERTAAFNEVRIGQMNAEAKKQGWEPETPWN